MSWRAELRSHGISTRPPPSADRGHVEQPGERTEPTRRRVVIPMEAIEREQLEALAEELGEPSPFEDEKPKETPLVVVKPSAFKPPSPPLLESKAENETSETSGRRQRRAFSEETKAAAAARVIDGGEYQYVVAADFGVAQSDVSRWVIKERERRAMANERQAKKSAVFHSWRDKLEAVRRVRALEKERPDKRGHQAAVGREMGIDAGLISNWCRSGEFEPEPEQQESKTMMSRPEPQPMSQPMPPPSAPPVTYTQPMYAASHMPPPPPPWWNQQQPQPPSAPQPSPQMMGLEEYIKKTIEYEVARQVPLAVNAILERMWGKR